MQGDILAALTQRGGNTTIDGLHQRFEIVDWSRQQQKGVLALEQAVAKTEASICVDDGQTQW